jgi:hypothetical protein
MMVLLIVALLIVALAAASLLGLTADTRDPDYGMAGLVGLRPRTEDDAQELTAAR